MKSKLKFWKFHVPMTYICRTLLKKKKSKYALLNDAIESKGYQCNIVPFIVGSVGLVHSFCYVYLVQLGILKRQTRDFVSGVQTRISSSQEIFGTLDVV